jgi:hypothetical protein
VLIWAGAVAFGDSLLLAQAFVVSTWQVPQATFPGTWPGAATVTAF